MAGASRIVIARGDGAVRIVVPAGFRGAAAGWGIATFLLWGLTALPLAIGALVSRAVGAPSAPPTLFFGMMLAFLPFAVFGVFLVLWSLGGAEEITADGSMFAVRRRVLGVLLPARRYDAAHIAMLRVAPHPYMRAWNPWAPLLGGTIAFDYGAMTYRFAAGLALADAQRVVDALSAMLPTDSEHAHELGEVARPGTVRLPHSRYRIDERPEGFTITMPYDFRLVPRPLWAIIGWVPLSAFFVMGGVALTTGSLVAAIIGGFISVLVVGILVATQASFLRLVEVFEIVPEQELFARRIEYWGFRSSGTRLNMGHVRKMRVELPRGGDVAQAYADMARKRSGPLAIDFGEETYRFGMWVSEAEARLVVSELLARYPQFGMDARSGSDDG